MSSLAAPCTARAAGHLCTPARCSTRVQSSAHRIIKFLTSRKLFERTHPFRITTAESQVLIISRYNIMSGFMDLSSGLINEGIG